LSSIQGKDDLTTTHTPQKKQRYKHIGGKRWIEVRIKNPLQLFDAKDPAPFRERDLDDDFIEYVSACAREFSFNTPLKVMIYIEDPESKELSKESIREAIHSYFAYRIDLQQSELKSFLRRAQMFLLMGLFVLGVALTIAQNITLQNSPGFLGVLREGIVIFGWFSIWKPIELIMFDWFPLYEKLRFYRKLAITEIEIKFSSV